jgi:hypothetical protein
MRCQWARSSTRCGHDRQSISDRQAMPAHRRLFRNQDSNRGVGFQANSKTSAGDLVLTTAPAFDLRQHERRAIGDSDPNWTSMMKEGCSRTTTPAFRLAAGGATFLRWHLARIQSDAWPDGTSKATRAREGWCGGVGQRRFLIANAALLSFPNNGIAYLVSPFPHEHVPRLNSLLMKTISPCLRGMYKVTR